MPLRGHLFFCFKVDLDYTPPMEMDLTPADRAALLRAIASREGNAAQLAKRYGYTTNQLRTFVAENRAEIAAMAEALAEYETDAGMITPTQLEDLWISNKFQRLKRLQDLAEVQYRDAAHGKLEGVELSTALREFRSYLALAANELGQLLHRGSGDGGSGDTLSVDFQGVDPDNLK